MSNKVNEQEHNLVPIDEQPQAAMMVNPLPPEVLCLDPEFLSSYVYSFGHGQNKVVDLDAGGYRHIATILNISIVECDITELPDDKGLLGKAKAVNNITGQTYIAHVQQPLKRPGGKDVRSAYEVCNTRVCRNAIRGLIPQSIITDAIVHSQQFSSGQAQVSSPLAQAKANARKALTNAKKRLQELGITADQVFEQAKERNGPVTDWTIAHWEDFGVDIRNLKRSWIADLAEQEQNGKEESNGKD